MRLMDRCCELDTDRGAQRSSRECRNQQLSQVLEVGEMVRWRSKDSLRQMMMQRRDGVERWEMSE